MRNIRTFILAFLFLQGIFSCNSSRIWTIYSADTRYTTFDNYNFSIKYHEETGVKSLYLVDSLNFPNFYCIVKSEKSGHNYIIPKHLLKEKGLTEKKMLNRHDCYLMIEKTKYFMGFLFGDKEKNDVLCLDRRSNYEETVMTDLPLENIKKFRSVHFIKPPDYYLIYFVRGILFNALTNYYTIYENVPFPKPYGYYLMAMPVWK